MAIRSSKSGERSRSPSLGFFPTGFFLLTVSLICLGLGLSAYDNFKSRIQLSQRFVQDRGKDIFASIESQTSGPGRRNPRTWQRVFNRSFPIFQDSIRFLALLDEDGKTLAYSGQPFDLTQNPNTGILTADSIYLYRQPLYLSPPANDDERPTVGWEVIVGMDAASTVLAVRQGYIHFAVSGLAILTLAGLSIYTLWVLRRFVKLKARESSERRLATLGRMAATLAHEIRNPLGAVKGLTQVAREQLPPNHQALSLMDSVVNEAARLEQLVTDLLTFARPRRASLADFDVAQVIRDLKHVLQPQLFNKGLRLDLKLAKDSMLICSDEDGLRQVLFNVLLNALDASDSGDSITLTLASTADQGILIHVDDLGKGLGDSDPEEFFEPFTTTKVHGSGLGLPISRQIMMGLDGAIELTRRRSRGTRCTITLPGSLSAA